MNRFGLDSPFLLISSLFNLAEAKEQGTILFHHGDVNAIEFAGKEMLLSGGSDGKVVLWKTKDWSRVKTLGSHRYFLSPCLILVLRCIISVCIPPIKSPSR